MHSPLRSILAWIPLLTLFACASPHRHITAAPPGLGGFPHTCTEDGLELVAAFENVLPETGELCIRVRMTPAHEILGARLYLQNGNVLGLSRMDQGQLYFHLPPNLRVRGHYALTTRRSIYREVDLDHSLLSLGIQTKDGALETRVGLRSGDEI